jgi:Ca-activated chloride channel family protein
VFITDGSVGNEDALFEFIGQHIGASRLFTIGIGSAPNGHFMKRAAILGKGTFTHIGKHYQVNQEMTELFKRLESPVLTDIRFDWTGESPESYPAPIPDLYAGEPLVVLFKAKDLDKEIVINASVGSKKWNQRVSLKGGLTQAGIARLYARRKIDAIELSFNELVPTLHWQGARRKIKEEVTKTGLQYQLVTKHTSLVAVEKESSVPFEEKLKTWPVPINLPEGWQHGSAWEQPAQELIVEDATAMMAPLAKVKYERVSAFAELYDLRYDLRKEAKVVRGEREVQLIAENGAIHKRKAEKARPYAKKNPLPQTDSPASSAMQIAMAQILPRTATPAQLFMIIGALLLLTALLLRRRLFSRW